MLSMKQIYLQCDFTFGICLFLKILAKNPLEGFIINRQGVSLKRSSKENDGANVRNDFNN